MPFPYSGNPKDALLRHYPSHSRGTGRDGSVGIETRYGLDGPGIESRWWGGGARFSAPVQTCPGVHPSSCTMGTGSFPGVKRPGRGVDHPPPCSTEVKERVEPYLYSPLWVFVACSRENLLFTCIFTAEVQHSTDTRYVTKRTLSDMFHVADYVCRVLGSPEYKSDCFKTKLNASTNKGFIPNLFNGFIPQRKVRSQNHAKRELLLHTTCVSNYCTKLSLCAPTCFGLQL